MIHWRKLALIMGIAGMLAGSGLAASYSAAAAAPTAKFSFSESLRQEQLTTVDQEGFSRTTETQTASAGKVTMEVELQLIGLDINSLKGDTPFNIQAEDSSLTPHWVLTRSSSLARPASGCSSSGPVAPATAAPRRSLPIYDGTGKS